MEIDDTTNKSYNKPIKLRQNAVKTARRTDDLVGCEENKPKSRQTVLQLNQKKEVTQMVKNPAASATGAQKLTRVQKFFKDCRLQHQLILMVIPGIVLVFIFNYIPMYGALMAFQEYSPTKGIWGSEWVGLKYFAMFFQSPYSGRLIKNTLLLGIYNLLWSFPAPIILALFLDQLPFMRYKKFVQTVSYFPHFISAVVIVGMVKEFCAIDGVFNAIRVMLGGEAVSFMTGPQYFRTIFIASGIWQGIGWGTIIYLAALSNVDPQLHEAATIDGASRFQRVLHIDLPTILPTASILLIMNAGRIMTVGFEKVYLMQNTMNTTVSEVISTYVYKVSLASTIPDFSYGTTIDLFNSVINLILIVSVNFLSKRVGGSSLF